MLRAAFATRSSRLKTSTCRDQAVKNHKLRSKDLAFVQTPRRSRAFRRRRTTASCAARRRPVRRPPRRRRYAWTKDADGVVTYPKENTFEPPVRTPRGERLWTSPGGAGGGTINDEDRGADEDQARPTRTLDAQRPRPRLAS